VKLFPAIDLLGGKAVRLEEGKRERATVFHDRPVELVSELARGGADRLHVVDLDGAFGEPRQLALVASIVAASSTGIARRSRACSGRVRRSSCSAPRRCAIRASSRKPAGPTPAA